MNLSLRQVPAASWKPRNTRPIALLRTPVPALARRLRLRFEDDVDELDYVKFAVIEMLPTGQKLALVAHKRSPQPGIEVLADTAANPAISLASFLLVTGLRSESLIWFAPLIAEKSAGRATSSTERWSVKNGRKTAAKKSPAKKASRATTHAVSKKVPSRRSKQGI